MKLTKFNDQLYHQMSELKISVTDAGGTLNMNI